MNFLVQRNAQGGPILDTLPPRPGVFFGFVSVYVCDYAVERLLIDSADCAAGRGGGWGKQATCGSCFMLKCFNSSSMVTLYEFETVQNVKRVNQFDSVEHSKHVQHVRHVDHVEQMKNINHPTCITRLSFQVVRHVKHGQMLMLFKWFTVFILINMVE